MDNNVKIKNQVAELRKEKKISQTVLANAVFVTRQTITSIEVGKYNASLELAYRIAGCFDLKIEDVFDFSEIEGMEGLINLKIRSVENVIFEIEGSEEPIAYDDSYSTNEDTVLTIDPVDLISNDTDPDGTIVSWGWSFGDGDIGIVQNPSHKFETVGTFTVTLTVVDNDGAMDFHSVDIEVKKKPSDDGPGFIPGFEPMLVED